MPSHDPTPQASRGAADRDPTPPPPPRGGDGNRADSRTDVRADARGDAQADVRAVTHADAHGHTPTRVHARSSAHRHRDGDEGQSFHQAVWSLVRRIPRGRATSYGAIASHLGAPRAARGVGYALSALPADTDVPWWRVVNRNGEISIKGEPGLATLQRTLLEADGIAFDTDGRIDLVRYGWKGPEGS